MPEVFAHNKACDTDHWAGETALNGFEELVLVDDIMEIPPFNNYEEVIENFWPAFIADDVIK